MYVYLATYCVIFTHAQYGGRMPRWSLYCVTLCVCVCVCVCVCAGVWLRPLQCLPRGQRVLQFVVYGECSQDPQCSAGQVQLKTTPPQGPYWTISINVLCYIVMSSVVTSCLYSDDVINSYLVICEGQSL